MRNLLETRAVWSEIDLDKLAHNIKEVKRISKEGTLVTAVVKADGYGHGAVVVAKTFLDNGADRLAVATLSEALELRRANIKAPILILGYTPYYQGREIIENDIIQTVYNYNDAYRLSETANSLGVKIKLHIKIDTGMGRLGFIPAEDSIEEIIKITRLEDVYVEGIFTHLSSADEKDKTFTLNQKDKFQWLIDRLEEKQVHIPLKHISNSAAIIDLQDFNFDMIRAGIMLYGLYPSEEVNKTNAILKTAMTLKCRISNLKVVPADTEISYGRIFKTDKVSKIATLPLGYADGFTRMLTNKAEVSVLGKRAPVVGKICMDQCMIDVTDIENVKVGDEVILFGDGRENSPHIDEIAKKIGTINYEVVCMVSKRVPRVYIKNREIVEIVDYILD